MPDGVDLYLKDWKLFAKCDGGFRKALGSCRHGGATPVRIVALAASTSSGCIE